MVATATKQLLDFKVKLQAAVENDPPSHGVDALLGELLQSTEDLQARWKERDTEQEGK